MTSDGTTWGEGATRDEKGRFLSPWDQDEDARTARHMIRWIRERRRRGGLPSPPPEGVPRADPRIARDRASPGELRLTWVGHSTVLVQIGGLNLLTDPIWSLRASPVRWAGPTRVSPPGVLFGELPPLDGVLLSHDHYDHLDDTTVRRLAQRFPHLSWFAPLGHGDWLRERGAADIRQMDWGTEVAVPGPFGNLQLTALPARHWTRRTFRGRNRRLWCSYALVVPGGPAAYFGGDSGYCPVFERIGERYGPFDAAILPIGAYEPRWFMEPQHMNPEEAVRTYQDLGGSGTFMGVHWGAFQLTDEPVLEPPDRTRAAWTRARLPAVDLWLPAVGETRVVVG